ncbi:hypothetical protein [Pseudochryseolinea flava]|uniref:Uncharacterized protein n=1 Tax=Pseudochryseolinea flava TaxID=2059302 RepID=A0A364Y8P9_9BACT|nr:hypothetical protein [Pseudochryseolinea flava]RAW03283.1 hypothetical protein DQQ10_04155 [Pseudochryseolinea flava]
MKIFKKIDFFAQLLLLITAAIFACLITIDDEYFFFVLLAQFLIGCLQYFSCLVTIITSTTLRNAKVTHLTIATVYLIFLLLGSSQVIAVSDLVEIIYTFVAPWALAIYYFILTWIFNFPNNRHNGSFLRHISF